MIIACGYESASRNRERTCRRARDNPDNFFEKFDAECILVDVNDGYGIDLGVVGCDTEDRVQTVPLDFSVTAPIKHRIEHRWRCCQRASFDDLRNGEIAWGLVYLKGNGARGAPRTCGHVVAPDRMPYGCAIRTWASRHD